MQVIFSKLNLKFRLVKLCKSTMWILTKKCWWPLNTVSKHALYVPHKIWQLHNTTKLMHVISSSHISCSTILLLSIAARHTTKETTSSVHWSYSWILPAIELCKQIFRRRTVCHIYKGIVKNMCTGPSRGKGGSQGNYPEALAKEGPSYLLCLGQTVVENKQKFYKFMK